MIRNHQPITNAIAVARRCGPAVIAIGAAALATLSAAGSAHARIEIWAARITEGDLWVMGQNGTPDTPVTLDDRFGTTSDSSGRFEFRIAYHPATCVVTVKTPVEARAVVVGNCGQSGPRGEPGPAGPPGPNGAPGSASAAAPDFSAPARPPLTPDQMPVSGKTVDASCGAKAARYTAETGAKVWVVRRGRMSRQNPLRPMPGLPSALVLQVNIEGRLASAYGTSFVAMAQGGSPEQVEQDSGNPIEWLPVLDPLPDTIQIVGDGGARVFARLTFEQCGTPPRVQVEARRPARKPDARPRVEEPGSAGPDAPRGLSLPKSAIDELPPPR